MTNVCISTQPEISNLLLNQTKIVIPDNPDVTFANSDNKKAHIMSFEIPAIDQFVEPSKPAGRPKSSKLSALAAKRNIGKKNIKPDVNGTKPLTNDNVKGNLTDVTPHRQNGLSVSQKLALSQNLQHMASQVRTGTESGMSGDLIGMTQGLNCKEIDSDNVKRMVLNGPSKGTTVLLPGRSRHDRRAEYLRPLISPRIATSTKLDYSFLRMDCIEISCFDFMTSPANDIMMDIKKEQEKMQRRNQRTKRLLKPMSPKKSAPKRKSETVDALSIRKILKRRFKEDNSRYSRIAVIGPQSSGKSSIMGRLFYGLNEKLDEKYMNKLRWEAQKIGRPHECFAWILDQLDGERKFGRSRDVGDFMLRLSSEKIGHIFDCPGDFDRLSTNIDSMLVADKLVLVVDVDGISQKESKERKRVGDLLKLVCETNRNVPEIVVVLNKMDQCQWSKTMAEKAAKIMTSMMEMCFMSRDHQLTFIPVSGRTGEGIMKQQNHIESELLSQNSVFESIETLSDISTINSEPQEHDLQPLVAVVQDVYENMGAGFTAVLLIKDGVLVPGQQLTCSSSCVTAHVKTVQLVRETKLLGVAAAVRGELVHAVLRNVDFGKVQPGDVMCDQKLISAINGVSDKTPNLLDMKTGRSWKAEVFIHDLNGRSIIPGRHIIFHSFFKSCHGYLRRLLWVSTSNGKKVGEGDVVKSKPYVVSTNGVTLGVELQLDETHTCLVDRSVNSEFTLFDGASLFASGSLVEFIPDFVDETENPYDLQDRNTLFFHREVEVEDMEVDDENS